MPVKTLLSSVVKEKIGVVPAQTSVKSKPYGISRYAKIIGHVLAPMIHQDIKADDYRYNFSRMDFILAATALDLELPKNLGDIIYSFRYRAKLPSAITAIIPEGKELLIEGAGRGLYAARLINKITIKADMSIKAVVIEDSSPKLIMAVAATDEQGLLAQVRYNRLIDIFLGICAYSVQNHFRTTVTGIGQIEIDEVYVGMDRTGRKHVIPVQAKSFGEHHSAVQTLQDIRCCREKFPEMVCRAVSVIPLEDASVALFELEEINGDLVVVAENHFQFID